MNTLLINRTFQVEGSWYAPKDKLLGFNSVLSFSLLNTMSSAGDWDGIFFQLINGKVYGIPFSQENNCPNSGYTLYTGNIYCSISHKEWNNDTKEEVLSKLL